MKLTEQTTIQLIPVCIALAYFTHPSAVWSGRAWMTLILLLAWATRLMHNYLRRERWVFGDREDWRYSDMREKFGGWWWFISFFAVSGAQHPMLVGMTLPLAATMLDPNPSPLGLSDVVALTVCCCGLAVGAIADNQLWAFMNRADKSDLLLDTGLWHCSRHPNHFGEVPPHCARAHTHTHTHTATVVGRSRALRRRPRAVVGAGGRCLQPPLGHLCDAAPHRGAHAQAGGTPRHLHGVPGADFPHLPHARREDSHPVMHRTPPHLTTTRLIIIII